MLQVVNEDASLFIIYALNATVVSWRPRSEPYLVCADDSLVKFAVSTSESTMASSGIGSVKVDHRKPLSNSEQITNLADLAIVCSNYHRLLHRGEQVKSIQTLQKLIASCEPRK